jgi:hypothetical protein
VAAPPQRAPSWEEELKRLLEGKTAEPPPSPPVPPPILVQRPRPAPPPPVSIPEEFSESTYSREHSPVEVTFKPLPTLTESVHTIQEATSLEQKVQQHLREATEKPVQMTKVEHKASTREAVEVRAMVRNPKSLRSALVASVILGPPRALAD